MRTRLAIVFAICLAVALAHACIDRVPSAANGNLDCYYKDRRVWSGSADLEGEGLAADEFFSRRWRLCAEDDDGAVCDLDLTKTGR